VTHVAISVQHIASTVQRYLDRYPQEKNQLALLLELLDQDADLTSRKEMRGHVTAGAVLTDPSGRVLFIHHVALDRWLLPGGHVEPGDERLISSALRELTEETGIGMATVVPLGDEPVHIDIHTIPANPSKGEGEHPHIDFRFLFTTAADVSALQLEEVSDAAWRGVENIQDETLSSRVRAATGRL
jgi:8-oxo-dGTP pyrophosphatase MutT (NUDIX family)